MYKLGRLYCIVFAALIAKKLLCRAVYRRWDNAEKLEPTM